jgi:hypothetical protein
MIPVRQMQQGKLSPFVEFAVLGALMAAVPSIVALDQELFLFGSSEVSVTELTQETLILLAAIMFGICAWRQPDYRGWLVLVAGLFACMFIREVDMWLDRIAKGFWIYPAMFTAIAAMAYSARHRKTLWPAMAAYAATRSHAYLATGLLIVVVFSRLFGAGSFWQEMLAEAYDPAIKTIIQEGVELLGYILIAFGSARFFFQTRRIRPDQG